MGSRKIPVDMTAPVETFSMRRQGSSDLVIQRTGYTVECGDQATRINLKLIIVSGKTKEFLFLPTTTATEIAHHVYDNWPEDWESRSVSKAEILRLIYHGRFLHGNVTLGALNLPLGKTTVMHLVPREHLPEPNSQDDPKQKKTGSRSCCSSCCTIV